MKHSLYKNQKTILLVLGMTLCTLSSCNPHKVSQGEMVTTADSAAVEDTVCADNSIANSCPVDSDTATPSPSASSSSSTEASGSLAETAYNAGYRNGVIWVNIWTLDKLTCNNDEKLKEKYVAVCQKEIDNMKKEYAGNRSMYQEYRRGVLKAYKENEDAKNAL